jgi:hypothetical protein
MRFLISLNMIQSMISAMIDDKKRYLTMYDI